MYVAVILVAAMLCGTGFVLQQQAAEKVRTADFLRLSLITALVHKRRWLAGIAVMTAGYLLVAWTLGHLTLSVSEPLLTTSLIFALVLAAPLSGHALRKTDIAGAALLTAGVAALSATRDVRTPAESFGSFSHWPAAAVIAVIAAILVRLGRQRSGQVRATLTGTASGLVLGIADAFTRRSVQMLDSHHAASLLTSWPGYSALAASIIGFWLMQNAFNAAPLQASLPAVTAAEPTAGIVLGVVVFGDTVDLTPWLLALQAAGVAAMVAGVILVARAHVFRDLHLRELPHVALERLQHPVAVHLPGAHRDDHASPADDPAVRNLPASGAPEPRESGNSDGENTGPNGENTGPNGENAAGTSAMSDPPGTLVPRDPLASG
jgi:drug/metabolite transporter (DMT)-like permease